MIIGFLDWINSEPKTICFSFLEFALYFKNYSIIALWNFYVSYLKNRSPKEIQS